MAAADLLRLIADHSGSSLPLALQPPSAAAADGATRASGGNGDAATRGGGEGAGRSGDGGGELPPALLGVCEAKSMRGRLTGHKSKDAPLDSQVEVRLRRLFFPEGTERLWALNTVLPPQLARPAGDDSLSAREYACRRVRCGPPGPGDAPYAPLAPVGNATSRAPTAGVGASARSPGSAGAGFGDARREARGLQSEPATRQRALSSGQWSSARRLPGRHYDQTAAERPHTHTHTTITHSISSS